MAVGTANSAESGVRIQSPCLFAGRTAKIAVNRLRTPFPKARGVRVLCLCILGLILTGAARAQQYPFLQITAPGAP